MPERELWYVEYSPSLGRWIIAHVAHNCHPVFTGNPTRLKFCPTCADPIPTVNRIRTEEVTAVDGTQVRAKNKANDWATLARVMVEAGTNRDP